MQFALSPGSEGTSFFPRVSKDELRFDDPADGV
jgi:hypothetical protein